MADPIVRIIGPDNYRGHFVDDRWIEPAGFESRGSTVRDCLQPFLDHFAADVEPYAPDDVVVLEDVDSRYFWYSSPGGKTLVDIHIDRGTENICIKQNLDFLVEQGDRINLGVLAC